MNEAIRTLIVDAHALVRAGLKELIAHQAHIVIVGEAGNRDDAIALATQTQPELILLEFNLDESEHLDIIPALLGVAPHARIILVTAINDLQVHYRAVQAGVMGVVLKHQPPQVLFKAITKVHSGEAWLDRATIATMLTQMSRGKPKDDPDTQKIASLSQREREVITMIGKGLKNKQIADMLSISEVTVRHHLTSIFSKLEITDRLELIIYAYQHHLADLPH
ncbi:MAG: response regulator transcription factor [Chloroflexi bacterium]|nr:response regulator transcription factor [Chloroflexota bacterium]